MVAHVVVVVIAAVVGLFLGMTVAAFAAMMGTFAPGGSSGASPYVLGSVAALVCGGAAYGLGLLVLRMLR
jgi:hypothetical protein